MGAPRRVAANLSRAGRLCKQSFCACAFILSVLGAGAALAGAGEAIQAIENKDWDRAYKMARATNDPVVMKIYFWRRFQDETHKGNFAGITRFVSQNPTWPAMPRIYQQMEKHMTGRENQGDLVRWFQEHPPLTPQGVDSYAKALLRTGKRDAFKAMINEWWATTLMERNDQKYIYRLYGDHITLQSHLRRYDKLLFNRQYTNARAIAQVLGKGYPALTEARIALAENKNGVDSLIDQVPGNLKHDPGLMYERLKWRRKKGMDSRAIEILNAPPPYEKIANPQDWWRERHIIIRRLLERQDYAKAYAVAAGHIQQDGFAFAQAQWLAGWLALTYMNKPAEAFDRFQQLDANVSTPVSLARAEYWAGRAAQALGQNDLAQIWYERAARYQTVFYGQKAARHVSVDTVLSHMSSPEITRDNRRRYEEDPLIKAAYLYHKAGFDDVASDFLWAFILQEGTAQAYMFAILSAADIDYYKDVVAIAKYATRKGLFITKQAYPTRVKDMRYAHKGVEWALIHALMRQESQFNARAQSPVGALGLMQLMPATAKLVARQQGVKHYTRWLVEKPEHNIKLGSSYLHDLLSKYRGDYVLAIAAYNAGPSRVNRWLKQFGDPRTTQISHTDWIELMPIYETRNYVQRVMEGLHVYRVLLHDHQPDPSHFTTISYH